MKKSILFAAAITLLASCANDEIVDKAANKDNIVPITLSTNRQNISRADGPTSNTLEANQHYNFGASAYKYTTGSKDATVVMENYLVGYAGDKVGYAHTANQTTWASGIGSQTDHKSPWVYEGLGTSEYAKASNETGENYYLSTDDYARYHSAHANQYLRYWDLAYANTNFYCYAPYMKEGVTLTVNANATATMTFGVDNSMKDGYDEPLNSAYIASKVDRSLSEFMYGGAKVTNSALNDVNVAFKHMGAQLFIRFYENIPGYKVELINLTEGSTSYNTIDRFQGIQATPAKVGTPYVSDKFFIKAGGKVEFAADATPTYTPNLANAERSAKNLMFKIPGAVSTYPSGIMPTTFAANLSNYPSNETPTYKIIAEAVTSGEQNTWSWSPTIYYPVPQNTEANGHTAGLTFHVSYRIIAEDNQEVITVHNATVHVPCAYTAWQAGNRYIYTFKITRDATGTTSPDAPINPEDPTPSTTKSLYPIVFDACTIEDYVDTDTKSDHTISDGTGYNQN